MDAERWQKIKSLFDAAQSIAPAKRGKFLAQACGADAELRREVERLLASFDGAESFMESPAAAEVPSLFEDKETLAAKHTTSDLTGGELVAGTVLASRYRIIGLIGKGGMGEVYRAEDIKLSQTVALKFLPDKLEKDRAALERFIGEVRTARQVAHPNVCRVFDIGEIDGRHFLSMEFVDGDDLSSLLRRVGRLTSERAVEISRQLCVGLHAIHDAGILHRDFKPANVIIDSKGKPRITDFGIAGFAEEISKDSLRVGTPAYMSPEQITGKEISARSDIYALGLVLYEIFTGKQAFSADSIPDLIKKHQSETPTNPSDYVKGIDPLVESVIFQCLEKESKDRPPSALHVAMALPGGNPLQVALEAGETPSPEMVAASPKKGALKPIAALSLLAAVIVCLGLLMLISKSSSLHRKVPLDKPPEVLSERSRELTEKFGYPPAFDSYHGFIYETHYLKHLAETDFSPTRWQKLQNGQPTVYKFWYRQSPAPIVPFDSSAVTVGDPPNNVAGMVQIYLDTKGRLIFFEGIAPRVETSAAVKSLDWEAIFKEAGFNLADFSETESVWIPPHAFDERRAWTGRYPEQPEVSIRVEAAAFRGKLVRFEIAEPWTKPVGEAPYQGGIQTGADGIQAGAAGIVLLAIFFTVLIVSTWLAIRNTRGGRSDLRGAFRLAVFFFVLRMIAWAFSVHHVATTDELGLLLGGLQSALFWSLFVGLMYLAFEPFLRKHAPERVISWNRLLAGNWRDPLVGRDVLIGGVAALICLVLGSLRSFVSNLIGEPPTIPWIISNPFGATLLGIRGFPVLFLNQITASVVQAFMISFLVLFFTLLLRRKWLGYAAIWLLLFTFVISDDIISGNTSSELVWSIVFPTYLVLTAARFGVLATISAFVFYHLFVFYPITTELSAWYAEDFILGAIFLIGAAIYGFYTSLAGQKIFGEKQFFGE